MKALKELWILMLLAGLAACKEDIVIDVVEGEPMLGVEASLTDEVKRHEAILSYTADFYNKDDIRMVSGATIYVTDGVDTIYYHEDAEQKGHYFTDSVGGRKNTLYRLCVDFRNDDGEMKHFFAESYLPDNVDHIDSLVVKHFNGLNDTVPTVIFMDTIEWVYPYFQSLPDPDIIYMAMLWKNDTLDSLAMPAAIAQGGFAGYYVNGPEMQEMNKEIPVGYFTRAKLKDGDRFHLDLHSITPEYYQYIFTMAMSSSSNPMMGAPANVDTNIKPDGEGVGWFFTSSVVTAETVFRK